MSCHDIGRGVNFIMTKVLEMYDDGKISKEAALEMVYTFPKAVHWCDGNEYEAQEELTQTHCARCLKKYNSAQEIADVDELQNLISNDDFSDGVSKRWIDRWYEVMKHDGFNGRSICKNCFKELFSGMFTEAGRNKILSFEATE